jgi:2-polyprenyl-3-methyl-5-hydroxy-6-metoxy-1,4-benzoquinol methylase
MAKYLIASAEKRASSDHFMRKLTAFVGIWQSLKVLDVGCGFGEKATMMKALGAYVIGLDISGDAVTFMDKKLAIESYCSSIEGWHHNSGCFDIVTMFEFVEHALVPLRSLEVAVDKMKPGGLLAIVTPNGTAGDKRLFPVQNEWIGFQVNLEHMQYLHAETVDYLAHKLNCRIVHLEQLGFRPIEDISEPIKSVSSAATQRFRLCVKNMPGVRRTVYTLRDLQRQWRAAGIPSYDAGIYHLFAVLQKME